MTFDELRAAPSDAAEGAFHLDGELQVGREARSPVEWMTSAWYAVTLRGPAPEARKFMAFAIAAALESPV